MSYHRSTCTCSEVCNETSHNNLAIRDKLAQFNGKIQGFPADKGYFVLLQHTFGRNRQLKTILKKMSTGIQAQIRNESELQRTQRSSLAKHIDVNKSFKLKKTTNHVHTDPCTQQQIEGKEDWKSLMLRRKNNGKKGQIRRGKAGKARESMIKSQQKSPTQHATSKIIQVKSQKHSHPEPTEDKEESIRIRISSIRLSALSHQSHPTKLKNCSYSDRRCPTLKQIQTRSYRRNTVSKFIEPVSEPVPPTPTPERSNLSPWQTEGRVK